MNCIYTFKLNKNSSWAAFLLIFFISIGYSQNNKGSVSGVVRDATGKPVEAAIVVVKKINKRTYTDENGTFILKNMPIGQHVVIIRGLGYLAVEKNVHVKTEAATVIDNIVLTEDLTQLDEVSIFSNTNKFAKKETESVARLPLRNLENPQVYNVVGKDLMKEQIVLERTDIYRNIPGAVPNYSAGGSQGLMMRGFSNTSGMLNGMNTSPVYPLNPAILESIEFIKGPSGTLFGGTRNTSFGGVYNYVTKKPNDNFGGEVSFTGGSFNFTRATADVNTSLNKEKTALLRLNVAGQSEGSFQDQGYAKNYVFAPSFSYQLTDRLKFSVDLDITKSAYTMTTISIGSLTNVSARSFEDLEFDYNRSYANNDVDAEIGVNNLGAQIDYKISDQWKSETKFLSSVGYYKHLLWTNLNVLTDSTATRVIRNQTPETFGNIHLQQNFTGDFKIGTLRNRMLIGVDYNNAYNELNRVVGINYDVINVNQPLNDFNAEKIKDLSYAKGFSASTTKAETYGFYISDVVNVTPSLMAMLSLRLDRFSTKGSYNVSTGIYAPNTAYQQTSLAPKFGFVYQPVEGKISVFANYMNGFTNLAPVVQPDNSVMKLDPQYGTQWETGIKVAILDNKLSGSISYYDISVTNSTYRDAVTTYTIQDGTQKSKGVDVELIANPIPGLNIVGGYAYNENKYTRASTALLGKSLVASPKNVANIWASYVVPEGKIKGLGIGVGGNYVSDSWFETTNTFVLPSYTLLNGTLFYDQPKYRIALKGNNLLNEKYWNATGMPQKTINFLVSLAFKF
ncbi:iron complex outermembrane recepter protein [Flavobacterium flevense]|uniref:TonB-dependent receptor n=1 Tax=Flavobacterium flevense TaxID=983 RepID=A0A4Y4AUP2_9FLAO|nr:TonB-dependent receptor [Flavobacterium flevense]GEC71079.1 TonB-dependent receptor [Flavobacterium flevense]SHL75462.1 iron complex outermembrane recepter protein [Flavobacterium flevense]